jgi:hypothetical protein
MQQDLLSEQTNKHTLDSNMPGLCDQDIKKIKGHAQLKEVVRQISDVLKILGNFGRCGNALQYHEQRCTDGLDVNFSRAWRLDPFRFLGATAEPLFVKGKGKDLLIPNILKTRQQSKRRELERKSQSGHERGKDKDEFRNLSKYRLAISCIGRKYGLQKFEAPLEAVPKIS